VAGTAAAPRAVAAQLPARERALAGVEARHERGEQQQERQAVEQEAHCTGTSNFVVYSSKSETRSVTVTVHFPPGAKDMALAT
jgi:hypothetical protein